MDATCVRRHIDTMPPPAERLTSERALTSGVARGMRVSRLFGYRTRMTKAQGSTSSRTSSSCVFVCPPLCCMMLLIELETTADRDSVKITRKWKELEPQAWGAVELEAERERLDETT